MDKPVRTDKNHYQSQQLTKSFQKEEKEKTTSDANTSQDTFQGKFLEFIKEFDKQEQKERKLREEFCVFMDSRRKWASHTIQHNEWLLHNITNGLKIQSDSYAIINDIILHHSILNRQPGQSHLHQINEDEQQRKKHTSSDYPIQFN